MTAAGRLAAAKPVATTNTKLYGTDINNTGAVVFSATNQSGSGVSYRAAVRDYNQIITLDGDESSSTDDSKKYEFTKGNAFANYKLTIEPGIQFNEATPGADIATTDGSIAKLLDVYKSTDTIQRYLKVAKILQTEGDSEQVTGSFTVGETLTGGFSGLTATLRAYEATTAAIYAEVADVAANATVVNVSRNTGLADGAMLMIAIDSVSATEIIEIDPTGINVANNQLTVTRGVLGTTASVIPAGAFAKSYIDSATTSTIDESGTFAAGDTTLTIADATGFLSGAFIQIGNEILQVSEVAGNDLTVVRGQYGTSAVNHNDGSAITQLTDAGDYYLNFFTEGETLTGGTSSATVALNFSQGSSNIINADKFIYAEGSAGGVYGLPLNPEMEVERSIRYHQTDASNTGHPFRLSEEIDGTQGLTGTEYTTGVTKVGTAGQAGCYLEIAITAATPLTLNSYAEPAVANTADDNAGYGWAITTVLEPFYKDIYIYAVRGKAFSPAAQFTIGATTYTIDAGGVTPGFYGYVHDWDADRNVLKISLDEGSPAVAVGDNLYDSVTEVDGSRRWTEVVSGKAQTLGSIGAADGSRTAGTYNGILPTGGSGSGLKVNVVVDGSGAATVTLVNGGKDYAAAETLTVTDAQLGGGGAANLTFNVATIGTGDAAGATTLVYCNAEDWFAYDKAIAANATDRITGVVVGPGQNILVYSSAADISYAVTGFESNADDYVVLSVSKNAAGGPTP